MNIFGFSVTEFITGLIGLGVTIVVVVRMWKEYHAQKRGLLGNPKRCEDHESRIRETEKTLNGLPSRLTSMEGDISDIKVDVRTLLNMHLKP
jgi:hypothetical protein